MLSRPDTAGRRTGATDRFAHRLGLLLGALVALALPASACPTCSVGQAVETLALIMCFMLIPYVIVGGVWLWVRSLLAREARAKEPETSG